MAQIIWAQGSRVNKGQRDTLWPWLNFRQTVNIDLSFFQTGLIIDHSFGHIQETLWTKSASRWAKAKSISPPARSTKNIRSDGKLSSLVDYQETKKDRENEERSYKEAFDYFDWNKSGTIPTRSENINATQNDVLLLIIKGTLVNWLQPLLNQHPPQWSSVCDEEGWTEPHRCRGLLRKNINFLKSSVFLFHDVIYTHPLLCLKVQDMVNKIDDGSGVLDFEDFLLVS